MLLGLARVTIALFARWAFHVLLLVRTPLHLSGPLAQKHWRTKSLHDPKNSEGLARMNTGQSDGQQMSRVKGGTWQHRSNGSNGTQDHS